MRRRSVVLSGCLLAGVVSCAFAAVPGSARAAYQDQQPAALAQTSTVMHLSVPTVRYDDEQAETITVAVSGAAGTPTGTVRVVTADNGTPVCTVTLSAGQGSCAPYANWDNPGQVTVEAAYSGDATFASSVSAAQTFVITRDSTSTALNVSPAIVTYGHEQSARVTAVVSAPYAHPEYSNGPSGDLKITLPVTLVCDIPSYNPVCSAALAATAYPAGVRRVTASYAGNTDFAPSASPAIWFKVAKATSKTVLRLSASRIVYGHERVERLRVAVIPRYAGTPGGTVTIWHGGRVLCRIRLAHGRGGCALAARALRPGRYHLVAAYAGNADFIGSKSATATLRVLR